MLSTVAGASSEGTVLHTSDDGLLRICRYSGIFVATEFRLTIMI
jgi:hypothetical protein